MRTIPTEKFGTFSIDEHVEWLVVEVLKVQGEDELIGVLKCLGALNLVDTDGSIERKNGDIVDVHRTYTSKPLLEEVVYSGGFENAEEDDDDEE